MVGSMVNSSLIEWFLETFYFLIEFKKKHSALHFHLNKKISEMNHTGFYIKGDTLSYLFF